MENQLRSVPRPLVRTNQWFIVLSVLLTWITKQEWILLIPLLAGLMGLFFGFNPIMRLAKLFLKKHPSQYIAEDWEQQQFNQTIAVICLAGGFISFLMNWTIVGYVFTIMVAAAAFIAILGFCVGCFIRYQWQQYQYRRSLDK
ncbi:DUF4395 domain-containing protein [Neobacillus mesonae]|uniref:DUF4395 domain-containing protein n=1 Tax=Neobacillus mesonae TaxID=1193713 RepID=A0A3T0I599_9BACI|nr:DUF4395 domain-containing protein [Neobacillus mesonae]AZU64507.1 hypothetical protein CHR53_26570 [Neobacillus mesonae]